MSLLKLTKTQYSQMFEQMPHMATKAVRVRLMTEATRAVLWTKRLASNT
jgi:hypothetical protein